MMKDLLFSNNTNSEYPVKCVSNHSHDGFERKLGQEVIGGRSYGSDLSPVWLNMLEGNGGKAKAYQ